MIKWSLKTFPIKKLKDYHKNPRKLSIEQYDQLKVSLEKFGLIDKPIVTQDGIIIGGHQRKNVLKKAGIKEVECYIPDRELTEKEIEELNIRLNKNTGSFDFDILANQFDLDELCQWGFKLEEFSISPLEITEAEPEKEECHLCDKCGQKIKNKGD